MTRRRNHPRLVAATTLLLLAGSAAHANDTPIRLASGETLRVSIIEQTQTHIRCSHPVLGEFLIPKDQVTILPSPDAPAPESAQPEVSAPPEAPTEDSDAPAAAPEPAPAPKLSFWSGWKRSVDIGVIGSDGNSETFGARAALGAQRKTDHMETTVGLSYVYNTDNGEKTKSRGELTARNDWLFGKDSRWGFFAEGKIEYDEFQDWDWRLSGFVGPSYAFIRNDKTLLRGRVGAGGSYELGGDDNGFEPELLIGLDFEHAFNARNRIFASGEYLPSLSNFPDYRVNSKAGWETIIDEKSGMNLKLGVVDRYDSDPGEGIKKNDIEYFITLGWSF
ncbi:MAG: DUF481 domain-containing protein [Phycisphaeraceae bacterium]|nr:DUF481 domain-containing protein [Phycisphaeraceae bacterium]